jgi:hypothetical protein
MVWQAELELVANLKMVPSLRAAFAKDRLNGNYSQSSVGPGLNSRDRAPRRRPYQPP